MAKKFQFKLEPVLKLRSYKVETAKNELAKVVTLRNEKEDDINSKSDYLDDMKKNNLKKMTISDIQARFYHKDFVESEIQKLEIEKQRLIEIETIKQKELAEKMQDEKAILKLKEKQSAEHKSQIDNEETKMLDDIAMARYIDNNKF